MKKLKVKSEKLKVDSGQSLFELVVAISISALVIVALVSLVTNSLRNATFAKNDALATAYAQQATEWLRSQRDTNISVFMTNVATPIWCLPDLSWNTIGTCTSDKVILGTPFLREGHFTTSVNAGKTQIQSDMVVTWTDGQGDHKVTNSTTLSDWRQR